MPQREGYVYHTPGGRRSIVPGPDGGASSFLELTDTPSAFTGSGGYAVVVNAAGDALEFVSTGSVGAASVLELTDTPGSYVDTAHHFLLVNASEDGVVFANAGDARTILNVDDGANNYAHPNHSGDVTSEGDGATTIAPNAVTLSKLATIGTQRLLGRNTTGVGNVEELSALPSDIHDLYALVGHLHDDRYGQLASTNTWLLQQTFNDAARIAGSPHAQMILDGGVGTRGILAMTSGVPRWTVAVANGAAESGGNAGSDFTLVRFDDSGTFMDAALAISRQSGTVTIANSIIASSNIQVTRTFADYLSSAQPQIYGGGSGVFGVGDLIIQPRTNSTVGDIHLATGLSGTVTTKAIVKHDGKVGLGITNPSSLLHLLNGDVRVQRQEATGAPIIVRALSQAGEELLWRFNEAAQGSVPANVWHFRSGGPTSRPIAFSIVNQDPSLFLDRNRRVGIGNSNPQARFHATLEAGGNFVAVSVSGVGGTAVDLLPAGTVSHKVFASGVVVASNGSRSSFSEPNTSAASDVLEPGGGVRFIYTDGALPTTDSLRLSVTAGGAVQVQRIDGSRTYLVIATLVWI